jgi:hypothetical protein
VAAWTGRVSGAFPRVHERATDDVEHVVVCQRVADVASVAAAHEQVLRAQDAQPLRDRGQALALGEGEIGHATGTVGETRKDAQPGFVTDGPEQARRALDGGRFSRKRPCLTLVVDGAAVRREASGALRHDLTIPTLAQ